MPPKLSEVPDSTINWNDINYTEASDRLRPKPGFKYCRQCEKLLPINAYNFYKQKTSPDSYQSICKKCSKANSKKQYKNRKERKYNEDEEF